MKIDMRATIFVTFLAIVGLVLSLVVRLGGFKTVTISEVDAGPWKTVYKPHLGAYYQIAPIIDEVEKYTRAHGDPCKLSYGQYLDNMDRVPEDRLHSNGGCIVDSTLTSLPADYVSGEIPRSHYVMGEFNGAPSIGPMKVYPRAKRYFEVHKLIEDGAVIEIYQVMDDQSVLTKYYFPVKAAGASPQSEQQPAPQ